MSYATQADMVDRFGEAELVQRTNRLTGGTAIDTVVLGRALADADAEVNGYLAVRYAMPLAATPPVITRVACDLARYYLHDDKVPDTVRQRYEDAVALLKRLAAGDVTLGPDAAAPPPAAAPGSVAEAVQAPARLFGASLLGQYSEV
ncbi:MAG TPA: DUF1320 domain-containing protein [Burkholderiaceae bacterium]|nr:DUF1320 domain-containing protein [Burkholderiaceae bacterium]